MRSAGRGAVLLPGPARDSRPAARAALGARSPARPILRRLQRSALGTLRRPSRRMVSSERGPTPGRPITIVSMAESYDFRGVERAWQERWEREGIYRTHDDASRPKYYTMEMLPYPSGDLHVGHAKNYILGDASRARCACSATTYCIRWVGTHSGLPAENAAIQRGIDPATWTPRTSRTCAARFG